jgi:hypothetical protein
VRSFASNPFGLSLSKPLPSHPFGLSLSKPLFEFSSGCFYGFRCRSVAAAGDRLSFASPKESRQRKGDPGACDPSLRYGYLPVLSPAGVELELGYRLRQSLALIRLSFRSSAHSQGFSPAGSGSDSGTGSSCAVAINFIAACARITGARGRKCSRNRRAAWFLGSDRNFSAQHPQGAPKARRIWALTPKTPDSEPDSEPESIANAVWQGRSAQRQADQGERLFEPKASSSSTPPDASSAGNPAAQRRGPDFGSPFFSLGFFGEAKKSRSPAAATERHRTHQRTRRSIQRKASTGSARTGLEYGFDNSARTVNSSSKLQHPTPC